MAVVLPRKPLPITRSLLWSPVPESSALPDAVLGGDADPYVLFITQRALIEIDACVPAAAAGGGTAFGLLAGERFDCPSTDTRYMVISSVLWAPDLIVRQSTVPPDTLAAAARELHAPPGQEILGWYRSGMSVGPDLSPADQDVHLKFFLMRWHVMLLSAPNADPPVGSIFTVDRASMHGGRVPFHELLHSSSLRPRGAGPKPTCVTWRSYACDEPVMPMSDEGREFVRATAEGDEGEAVPRFHPSPAPGPGWPSAEPPRPRAPGDRTPMAMTPTAATAAAPVSRTAAPPARQGSETPIRQPPPGPIAEPRPRGAEPPARRTEPLPREAEPPPRTAEPVSRDVSAQPPPHADLRPASEIRMERVYDPVADRPEIPAVERLGDADAAASDVAAARAPQPMVQAAPSRGWRNGSSVDLASPRAATSGLFGGWAQSEAEQVLMPPRRREVHHRSSRRVIRLLLAGLGALALIASAILALREYRLTESGLSVPVFAGGPDRTGGDVLKPAPPSDSLLNLFDRRAAALEQAIASYRTAERSFGRKQLRCPALRRAYGTVDDRFVELAKVLVPFDPRRTAEYDRFVGQVNGVEASFGQSGCGTTGTRD